ncbi:MAG: magnesium transporter [Nitrospirae bacterium]|nr:magnesium transporter [Nitrospirota bacterium]
MMEPTSSSPQAVSTPVDESQIKKLLTEVEQRAPDDAIKFLNDEPDTVIAQVLALLNPAMSLKILSRLEAERRQAVLSAVPAERSKQWARNEAYPEGTVGRLMDQPVAVFGMDLTVQEAVEQLRELVKQAFITYGYVTDPAGTLLGVIVMRDLLLADKTRRLREIMLRDPFYLTPHLSLADALQQALPRHYPVYPVCDEAGRLIGLVRGYVLFEEQTMVISAQPGRMVGVEEEDRLSTPWWRSLKFRHPWLQLNLLTAFLAAAVVGLFEKTIEQVVALAVFLPVLAGQSGNTGCQALAVTLRGMTLGELKAGKGKLLVTKEAFLGLLNGMFVGVTAGLGMYLYASLQHHPAALMLAFVVFLAMIASCVTSGLSGALIPMGLKKMGADPATASSIFLTTATDVVSMGVFLWLATLLVL